jgi:hypothetical protein
MIERLVGQQRARMSICVRSGTSASTDSPSSPPRSSGRAPCASPLERHSAGHAEVHGNHGVGKSRFGHNHVGAFDFGDRRWLASFHHRRNRRFGWFVFRRLFFRGLDFGFIELGRRGQRYCVRHRNVGRFGNAAFDLDHIGHQRPGDGPGEIAKDAHRWRLDCGLLRRRQFRIDRPAQRPCRGRRRFDW